MGSTLSASVGSCSSMFWTASFVLGTRDRATSLQPHHKDSAVVGTPESTETRDSISAKAHVDMLQDGYINELAFLTGMDQQLHAATAAGHEQKLGGDLHHRQPANNHHHMFISLFCPQAISEV